MSSGDGGSSPGREPLENDGGVIMATVPGASTAVAVRGAPFAGARAKATTAGATMGANS